MMAMLEREAAPEDADDEIEVTQVIGVDDEADGGVADDAISASTRHCRHSATPTTARPLVSDSPPAARA